MDLHVSIPLSNDGGYNLSDLPSPGVEAPLDPETIPTLEVANGLAFEFSPEAVDEPPTVVSMVEVGVGVGVGARVVESAASATGKPDSPAKAADSGPKLRRKRRVVRKPWDAPAWVVSALIHVGILCALAAVATSSGEVVKRLANLDSSLIPNKNPSNEMTPIYGDLEDVERTDAVGSTESSMAGSSGGFSTIGTAPTDTPAVGRTSRAVSENTSLPMIPTIIAPSGLQSTGVRLNHDLGGSGMISGDVARPAVDVGEALDQIASEILRHLTQHKLTVVWLFDESESMKDDQKEIRKKFDRVVNQLKINAPDEVPAAKGKKAKSNIPPLTHAIVGFGDEVHFSLEKPTADIDAIGQAIERLRIDSTGKENTMSAVARVIGHYTNLITDERKLLIVLVTDESGDDGDFVEEALQAVVSRKVPIYVIGRQSLFGTGHLTLQYTDPVTKDTFWVGIRRGPETAAVEALQYDGLHGRWDEVPSGFGPYELARLAKDSGGIYFLLPSEEGLRIKKREKAYSISTLKEYIPDYESRDKYLARREGSEFRRTLFDIIQVTASYPFRHRYPIFPDELRAAIEQELPIVNARLASLIKIEETLRKLEKLRNKEPDRRWQAAYDLMLAQIVDYQIKAYEYRANLLEMRKNPPKPKEMPTETLFVEWSMDHSHERKAPPENTEKVYAEALRLFRLVIDRHPNTPWADLAQDEIDRGFSVKRNEWHHKHSTRYQERLKLVPKF